MKGDGDFFKEYLSTLRETAKEAKVKADAAQAAATEATLAIGSLRQQVETLQRAHEECPIHDMPSEFSALKTKVEEHDEALEGVPALLTWLRTKVEEHVEAFKERRRLVAALIVCAVGAVLSAVFGVVMWFVNRGSP